MKNQQKDGLKLSLILPCYNEMEHIEKSLPEINRFVRFIWGEKGVEILLVDDGSTDGTRNFLSRLPQTENLHVIYNQQNLGRGGTVKVGLQSSRAAISGFMDIDREVSETYLPKFYQAIVEGADLVLGIRSYKFVPSPYGIIRWGTHEGYRTLVQRILKTKWHDTEVGYKFFSHRARQLALSETQSNDWFWDTEISVLCEWAKLECIEIPVLFRKNTEKTSTVRLFQDSIKYLRALQRFTLTREHS